MRVVLYARVDKESVGKLLIILQSGENSSQSILSLFRALLILFPYGNGNISIL